jgi:hypothetical protein
MTGFKSLIGSMEEMGSEFKEPDYKQFLQSLTSDSMISSPTTHQFSGFGVKGFSYLLTDDFFVLPITSVYDNYLKFNIIKE